VSHAGKRTLDSGAAGHLATTNCERKKAFGKSGEAHVVGEDKLGLSCQS